jgi:hypothetical protein
MSDFDFDVTGETSERRPWRPLPSNADLPKPSDAAKAEPPKQEKPEQA